MGHPKISIITINYNGDLFLEQTILSVINQTYPNIEFIIIDGRSTDNSLNIIKNYSSQISIHVSEPDHGIADAMNKGLKLSTGDLILFLHSDDYLISSTSIENAAKEVDLEYDIYAYPIRYGSTSSARSLYPRGFNLWINFKTGVFHQASMCKKEVFHRAGLFDKTFSIAMDYDFFLRAYRENCKIKICSTEFSFMRDTGISSQQDQSSLTSRFNEEYRIHMKNCRSVFLKFIYMLYWPLYKLYKSIKY